MMDTNHKIINTIKDGSNLIIEFFDFSLKVKQENVFEFFLYENKVLTTVEVKEIIYINIKELLKKKVLNYVTYKDRTKKEVKIKIKDIIENGDINFENKNVLEKFNISVLDFNANLISDIIADFEDTNYLNDKIYCKNYIEKMMMSKKSIYAIRKKLEDKLEDHFLIEDYILENEEYIYNLEFENCIKLYRKKIVEKENSIPLDKRVERVYAYLVQKSFSKEMVIDVEKLLKDEFREDEKDVFSKLEVEYLKLLSKSPFKNFLEKQILEDYEFKNKLIQKLVYKGFKYENISSYFEKRTNL